MGLSWWHILLVLLVFVLLFGTGKISGLMGDLATLAGDLACHLRFAVGSRQERGETAGLRQG